MAYTYNHLNNHHNHRPPIPYDSSTIPQFQRNYLPSHQFQQPGLPQVSPHYLPPSQPQYRPSWEPQSSPNDSMAQSSSSATTSSPADKERPIGKYWTGPAAPPPRSKFHGGYSYRILVEQQPDRARMCGFGDKDRRPISPPPCVLMRIYDARGTEIEYSRVENLSRFMVTVDVIQANDNVAVNLIAHPSSSPTISSTTQTAYPIAPSPMAAHYRNGPAYRNGNYHAAHRPMQGNGELSHRPNDATAVRNLLGASSGSAYKLKDTEGVLGLWFVFHDLSVRSEGEFRLKFRLFDLMSSMDLFAIPDGRGADGSAPSLATVHSDVFRVYSAKKFPGVWESTALSKCFAAQGIKIPIRKDGTGKRRRAGDGDDDGEASDDYD